MSEVRKLGDRELEKVDGGWITWNPTDKVWEALDDRSFEVLGSFSGAHNDPIARRAAQLCAAGAYNEPAELPYRMVVRQRKANQ